MLLLALSLLSALAQSFHCLPSCASSCSCLCYCISAAVTLSPCIRHYSRASALAPPPLTGLAHSAPTAYAVLPAALAHEEASSHLGWKIQWVNVYTQQLHLLTQTIECTFRVVMHDPWWKCVKGGDIMLAEHHDDEGLESGSPGPLSLILLPMDTVLRRMRFVSGVVEPY